MDANFIEGALEKPFIFHNAVVHNIMRLFYYQESDDVQAKLFEKYK